MKLALAVAAGLLLCLSSIDAGAVDCVPAPLPSSPTPPVYTMDVTNLSDQFRIEFWRQPCVDGLRNVLLRVTPTTAAPHVCGVPFKYIQGGVQYQISLLPSFSGGISFCGDLLVATTFATGVSPGPPPINISQAFSLVYLGTQGFTPKVFTLEIPAAGPQPPAPPSIAVIATGCTTCHPGNTAAFHAHIVNPGAAMLVELKTGIRFPDGSIINLLGRHAEQMLGAGQTIDIPMIEGVVPPGIPSGTYTIEAAILEPELGVTLGRHSLNATLSP